MTDAQKERYLDQNLVPEVVDGWPEYVTIAVWKWDGRRWQGPSWVGQNCW